MKIVKEGYHDIEKALEVNGTEPIVLDLRLQRSEVQLFVECNVAGASIEVDGKQVATTPQQAPILLEPGEHLLSVMKSGYRGVEDQKITAKKEALKLAVQLEVLPKKKPAPLVTVVREPEPRTSGVWKWVTIGLGVAIMAGGAGLQANAAGLANEANDLSTIGFDSFDAYEAEYESKWSSAESRLKGAYAMYGIGGAAVLGGILWLVLDRPGKAKTSSAVLRPAVGHGAIAVEAGVSF